MKPTPYDLHLLRRAKIAAPPLWGPEPRLCTGCAHQATTQEIDGEPVCERCAPPMTVPMAQRLAELDQANWTEMDRDRWKRRAFQAWALAAVLAMTGMVTAIVVAAALAGWVR